MKSDKIKKGIIAAFDSICQKYSLKKIRAHKVCSTCYEFLFSNKISGLKILYDIREGWLDIRLNRLIDGKFIEDPHTGWFQAKLNEVSLDYIVSYYESESCIEPIYKYPPDSIYKTAENGFCLYCGLYADQLNKYCADILCGDFSKFDNYIEYMKLKAYERLEKYNEGKRDNGSS